MSYTDWSELILRNFERYFYIPATSNLDWNFTIDSGFVNRRGIYKDTLYSKQKWADYQLRPNFTMAMVVAPELFNPEHAVHSLKVVETTLLGPLGIKTLDPIDLKYRSYYKNTVDSTEFESSKGFNYHNGPEWVWPLGLFFKS